MQTPCPLYHRGGCPTFDLQPTPDGTLFDGIVAHMVVVHKMSQRDAPEFVRKSGVW